MFSPLEQFEIFPIINMGLFSLTNSAFFVVLSVMLLVGLYYVTFLPQTGGNVVPNSYQQVSEGLLSFINAMVIETIGEKGKEYFPFVFALFSFILVCNLLGLIP